MRRWLFAIGFLLAGCGVAPPELEIAASVRGIELGSALGSPVHVEQNICPYGNNVSPACTTSNAPDMSFGWTAPNAGTFMFTTNGSNFDTVLRIALYDQPATVLGCINANAGSAGESLILSLPAGRRVLITIDGYASLCGRAVLNVSSLIPCPSTACSVGSYNAQGQCIQTLRPPGTICGAAGECMSSTCNGQGQCITAAAPIGTPCSFVATCQDAACDGAGSCGFTPSPFGTACEDGDSCTAGDYCNEGTCWSGQDVCQPPPCPGGYMQCPNGSCCNCCSSWPWEQCYCLAIE